MRVVTTLQIHIQHLSKHSESQHQHSGVVVLREAVEFLPNSILSPIIKWDLLVVRLGVLEGLHSAALLEITL